MIALTKKFYRDHRLGIGLMTVGLLFLQAELISVYPIFQKLDIEKITGQQPKALLALFGGTGIKLSFSSLEGFFNGEYLALSFLFIFAGYLIALVTAEFTKETESGTFESLLSLPVSRTVVAGYKYVNISLLTAYFTLIGIVPFALMSIASDFQFNRKGFLVVGVLTFLFYWTIASLASALSVFFSERSKPVFIILFILGYGFILNGLGQTFEKVKPFRVLSLFYYYDTVKALAEKTIGLHSLVVFGVLIVASTVFSFYWFQRRDFAG